MQTACRERAATPRSDRASVPDCWHPRILRTAGFPGCSRRSTSRTLGQFRIRRGPRNFPCPPRHPFARCSDTSSARRPPRAQETPTRRDQDRRGGARRRTGSGHACATSRASLCAAFQIHVHDCRTTTLRRLSATHPGPAAALDATAQLMPTNPRQDGETALHTPSFRRRSPSRPRQYGDRPYIAETSHTGPRSTTKPTRSPPVTGRKLRVQHFREPR